MTKILKRVTAMCCATIMAASTMAMSAGAKEATAKGTVTYNKKKYSTSAYLSCNRWDAVSTTSIKGPYCTSISTAVKYKYLDNSVGYKYVSAHNERSSGGGSVTAKASMPTSCHGNPNRFRSISATSTHGVTNGSSWKKPLSANYK